MDHITVIRQEVGVGVTSISDIPPEFTKREKYDSATSTVQFG